MPAKKVSKKKEENKVAVVNKKATTTKTKKIKITKEEPKKKATIKKVKNTEVVEVAAEEKTKKKRVAKKAKEAEKVEPQIEEPSLSFSKQQFLDLLTNMFYDKRSIGHLLFNGIFRLPSNKRLYEFSDEEIIRAFKQQFKIIENKREREISKDHKNEKLRAIVE